MVLASVGQRLPANAINGRCLDISKSRVQRIWHEVAGRSVAVDPRTYDGQIVMKPEENGRHGGRVVPGPLERTGAARHTSGSWKHRRRYVTQTRPVLSTVG